MNIEWIVTGMVLFGGMIVAALSLYIKKRKESQTMNTFTEIQSDNTESKEDEKIKND